MKENVIACGWILVSFVWPYLAFESYFRGKIGIFLLQSAVGVAFFVRVIVELRKARVI